MGVMTSILKGIIRYDGSSFAGWQRQRHERTVQGELEAALSRIASQPIRVQGASRTDAGVHAFGQVFSCTWPKPFQSGLRHALSQMLGPEIRITELTEAPDGFNARFDSLAKRYAYTIDLAREPDPFAARYAWHVPYRVDLDLLASLAARLPGKRDFAGFQSAGTQMKSTVRTLYGVTLQRGGVIGPQDHGDLWRLEFFGNGFLYKMVRNLTGTLAEIARGRFPVTFLEECLASPGPFRGHCAPAHGLVLLCVHYEQVGTQR